MSDDSKIAEEGPHECDDRWLIRCRKSVPGFLIDLWKIVAEYAARSLIHRFVSTSRAVNPSEAGLNISVAADAQVTSVAEFRSLESMFDGPQSFKFYVSAEYPGATLKIGFGSFNENLTLTWLHSHPRLTAIVSTHYHGSLAPYVSIGDQKRGFGYSKRLKSGRVRSKQCLIREDIPYSSKWPNAVFLHFDLCFQIGPSNILAYYRFSISAYARRGPYPAEVFIPIRHNQMEKPLLVQWWTHRSSFSSCELESLSNV